MIEYYEQLTEQEQEQVRQVVELLYRQTFVLERKYDKRTGRMVLNREYPICEKHLDFLKAYFAIVGIRLEENVSTGTIYIQGTHLIGDKLSRLATLYLLILKLIYEEQMEEASSSMHVFTTIAERHGRLGNFQLLERQPSVTEVRRAVAVLKRFQVIEPLDVMEELDMESRVVIYPSIHMVLMGDDVRALIQTFGEEETEDETE